MDNDIQAWKLLEPDVTRLMIRMSFAAINVKTRRYKQISAPDVTSRSSFRILGLPVLEQKIFKGFVHCDQQRFSHCDFDF